MPVKRCWYHLTIFAKSKYYFDVVLNRCVIEVFGGVSYVVTLHLGFFWGECRGFCHMTESDLFLFLL